MAVRVGLRDAVADFVVAVLRQEIQAACDCVLRDRGQPPQRVIAVGCNLARLIGFRNHSSERIVGSRRRRLVEIDHRRLPVQQVVLILRGVLPRVGNGDLIPAVVVLERGDVVESVGQRGAPSGIVVAVGRGVAVAS